MQQQNTQYSPRIVIPMNRTLGSQFSSIWEDIRLEVSVYGGLVKLNNINFINLFSLKKALNAPTYNVRSLSDLTSTFTIRLDNPTMVGSTLFISYHIPPNIKTYLTQRHGLEMSEEHSSLALGSMKHDIPRRDFQRFANTCNNKNYEVKLNMYHMVYRNGRDNKGKK